MSEVRDDRNLLGRIPDPTRSGSLPFVFLIVEIDIAFSEKLCGEKECVRLKIDAKNTTSIAVC